MSAVHLRQALAAWGKPEFHTVLKEEIASLGAAHLPLQEGLAASSCVADGGITVTILGAMEEAGLIRVKAGIFYTGVIAGCSCADDPTPLDEQNEYCVIQLAIDRATARTIITLLAD